MKNQRKNIQLRIISFTTILLTALIVTTSWATLTLLEPQTTANHLKSDREQIKANEAIQPSDKTKSHAPEPSTVALIGSGLVGMLISFVRKTYAIAKRAMDILLSIGGILLLSPLFIVTAILIKFTSKGPVLFTQVRVGKNGELFKIFKFRTMRVDAEKDTGPVWAAENDPRLIPIGKFLRKSHLDEIPQFINVLRGEMSVIGPRPERPIFVKELKKQISDYEKRLAVKPGITGLAQVWHRYDETLSDVRKKIKYDLLYIKKVCLWTDIRILFRTFRVVFTGEGAR